MPIYRDTYRQAISVPIKGEGFECYLDEVPWMATPRLSLLSAIEYSWNRCLLDEITQLTGKGGRLTFNLLLLHCTLFVTIAYLNNTK